MVALNARAELGMEIELIDELIEATQKFAAKASSPLETAILSGWERGLKKRKYLNEFYMKLSDTDFDTEVTNELSILQTFRQSLSGKRGDVADYWIEHIEEDIDVMNGLKG